MICRHCGFETRDPFELRNNKIIKGLLDQGLSVEKLAHILGVDLARVLQLSKERDYGFRSEAQRSWSSE